jgi:hypothetical protein
MWITLGQATKCSVSAVFFKIYFLKLCLNHKKTAQKGGLYRIFNLFQENRRFLIRPRGNSVTGTARRTTEILTRLRDTGQ